MKTLDLLFDETNLTFNDIAEKAGLPLKRLEAIALGRWTPSPDDRLRIARAFEVPVDEIIWGHTMDPRNIRYRQFGLKENF
jgi:transcriptional regulator with XRE-family HTH domain